MLHQILRREKIVVNHKRSERIYREEKLSIRLKHRKKRARHLREAMPVPKNRDDVWSMDFVHDQLVQGRWFKNLTIIDHCTRESPEIHTERSIRGEDVVSVLERLRLTGRKPKVVVVDNGPEFASRALAHWCSLHGVRLFFIEPGKPTQNAFIESFNGKFRDGCLNQHWFGSIEQARLIIQAWRKEYETERPHSSLGWKTPKEFAEGLTQMLMN